MKKSSISRNIALLMEHFGIKKENQLAKLVNMPQTTVNKLISGASADPRVSTLLPIITHFNISMDTLISDELPIFNTSKENEPIKSLVPLITYNELLDTYDNLSALTTSNWPHWHPLPPQKNLNHYAVYLKPEQFPIPFDQEAILIIKNEAHLLTNQYYIIKHISSNSVGLKKIIFDNGIHWLIALQQNIPATEFQSNECSILGRIEAQVIDMSNGHFIYVGD